MFGKTPKQKGCEKKTLGMFSKHALKTQIFFFSLVDFCLAKKSLKPPKRLNPVTWTRLPCLTQIPKTRPIIRTNFLKIKMLIFGWITQKHEKHHMNLEIKLKIKTKSHQTKDTKKKRTCKNIAKKHIEWE